MVEAFGPGGVDPPAQSFGGLMIEEARLGVRNRFVTGEGIAGHVAHG